MLVLTTKPTIRLDRTPKVVALKQPEEALRRREEALTPNLVLLPRLIPSLAPDGEIRWSD